MKRLSLILVSLVMLLGCNEEPPPPPHEIVGDWTLDVVYLKNLPQNYTLWENYYFTPAELFGDINTYKVAFNNDNTYLKTLDFVGPNETESGQWEIFDETSLILTPDNDPIDDEWNLVGPIEDFEMTLSKVGTGLILLNDQALDTLINKYPTSGPNLTQEQKDYNASVWDEAWTKTENSGETVSCDFWWIFNRQ